jgi:ubiquitin-protein ligase
LDKPNPASVASNEAYEVHARSVAEYNARIRREAAEYARKHNSDAAAGGGDGDGDG